MGIKDLLQPTVWAVFEYIQVLSFFVPFFRVNGCETSNHPRTSLKMFQTAPGW